MCQNINVTRLKVVREGLKGPHKLRKIKECAKRQRLSATGDGIQGYNPHIIYILQSSIRCSQESQLSYYQDWLMLNTWPQLNTCLTRDFSSMFSAVIWVVQMLLNCYIYTQTSGVRNQLKQWGWVRKTIKNWSSKLYITLVAVWSETSSKLSQFY